MRILWRVLLFQCGRIFNFRFNQNSAAIRAARAASVLLLLCFVAGCAIGPQLKPEAIGTVHDTSVRAYLSQNAVIGQWIRSGYGAGVGGLIGAVVDVSVDAGRRKESKERVSKIRDVTGDYDFRSKYWDSVSNQIQEVSWLKTSAFQGFPTGIDPVTKDRVAQGAVLNVGTDYYLSQDCRVLIVASGMGFFPPGKAGKAAAGNIVHYYSAEIGEPEGDEAIPLWTADNGAAFRSAAEEGIQESGKLVRYALEYMGRQSGGEERPATVKFRLNHARGDFGIKMSRVKMRGVVLEETPDRVIFREQDGHIYSLPAKEIELKWISKK